LIPLHQESTKRLPSDQGVSPPGDEDFNWVSLDTDQNGYLNFLKIEGGENLRRDAVAFAETYLNSPDERTVRFALGTDDGSMMWVNGELLYQDSTEHGARPYQYIGKLQLQTGLNHILLQVDNGVGDFGLYFQIFDQEVETATPSTD